MNRKLKMAAIMVLLCGAVPVCIAQQPTRMTFTYDANGNRITRSLVLKSVAVDSDTVVDYSAFTKKQNLQEDDAGFLHSTDDKFDAMEVSIYPNPTHNVLHLSVINADDSINMRTVLTTSTGAILHNRTVTVQNESFDFSSYPCGVYFLHMTIGEEHHVWKVIKY